MPDRDVIAITKNAFILQIVRYDLIARHAERHTAAAKVHFGSFGECCKPGLIFDRSGLRDLSRRLPGNPRMIVWVHVLDRQGHDRRRCVTVVLLHGVPHGVRK